MANPTSKEGLDPKQVNFVERTLRLFVALADSRVARRAVALAHYSKAQHERGITLRRRASGDEVPLPIDLAALVPTSASPWDEALTRLDVFENTWVPLSRTAADMSSTGDARTIVERLFDGFQQAPRGPEVVRTTTAWLAGWDALEQRQAEVAGAAALRQELYDTGLTDAQVAAVRADLKAIEAGGDMTPTPDPEAARDAALADQREAFVALKAWVKHWALRFRQTLPYQDLVKMGLRQVSRKPTAGEDEPVFEDDDTTTTD